MTKGTALFDTVAISGTEAGVRAARAGLVRRCVVGRVSANGVRGPIAMGLAGSAYAQWFGGVVRMEDGAVTFKGGSISNSSLRVASVRIACCMFLRCVLHRRALRVASLRVSCKRAAVPQRKVVQSIVWCLLRVRCSIGRRCCTM
jgi:hypothetical protein